MNSSNSKRFRAAASAGLVSAAAAILALAFAGCQRSTPPPAAAPPTSPPTPTAALTPGPAEIDLIGSATNAVQACPLPSAPSVPDGSKATLPQMKAAQGAFKAYDAATNAYTQCVDTTVNQLAKQHGSASATELRALNSFATTAHNAAIDQEQSAVDQFNSQVRIYKAKHPKG